MAFQEPRNVLAAAPTVSEIAEADALRRQADFQYGWQGQQARQAKLANDAMIAAGQHAKNIADAQYTLQSINDARLKHDQSIETFELDKKQKILDLEKARATGRISSLMADAMEQQIKAEGSQQSKILDAQSTMIDAAQHDAMQKEMQSKQGLASSMAALLMQRTNMQQSPMDAGIAMQAANQPQPITLAQPNGAMIIGRSPVQAAFDTANRFAPSGYMADPSKLAQREIS